MHWCGIKFILLFLLLIIWPYAKTIMLPLSYRHSTTVDMVEINNTFHFDCAFLYMPSQITTWDPSVTCAPTYGITRGFSRPQTQYPSISRPQLLPLDHASRHWQLGNEDCNELTNNRMHIISIVSLNFHLSTHRLAISLKFEDSTNV